MILIGLCLMGCGSKDKMNSSPNPEAGKYNRLAVDQQLKGQFDSALYFIDKAIEVDSLRYLYHFQRLTFLWALSRNEEALQAAKRISRLRNYDNMSIEGMAYERLGNLKKAKELYKVTVDNWPKQELDSSYQSRLEYSQLGTVVYGKEFGLKELSKIDTSKLNSGEIEVVETMRRTIERYEGDSYQQLVENINILPLKDRH